VEERDLSGSSAGRRRLDLHEELESVPGALGWRAPEDGKAARERRRGHLFGDVDWSQVDPLQLAHADRRADSLDSYQRPALGPAEVEAMKKRWQGKQVKRVSKAAQLFGARESQRDLWDFIAEHNSETQSAEAASVRDLDSGEAPAHSRSFYRAEEAPAQAVSQGWRQKAGSTDKHLDEESASMCSAAGTASAANTARAEKSGVTLRKQLTSVFKNLWGPPPDHNTRVERMLKKMKKSKGQNGRITL